MKDEQTLRLDMANRVASDFGLTVGSAAEPKRKGR